MELGARVEFLVMKCQCCFYDYCVSVIQGGENCLIPRCGESEGVDHNDRRCWKSEVAGFKGLKEFGGRLSSMHV